MPPIGGESLVKEGIGSTNAKKKNTKNLNPKNPKPQKPYNPKP
jgi:hypothetical protein